MLELASEEKESIDPPSGAHQRPYDDASFGTDSQCAHRVQFYEDEEFLISAVGKFLASGAVAGDSLVVIATERHREAFCEQLDSAGVDVATLLAGQRLTLLDADETLAQFMRNGRPDRELFQLAIGRLIADRAGVLLPGARLRAYGEMVDVLWRKEERDAAIHLEELWNELLNIHPFTLLCAYAMGSFYREPEGLSRVCAAHSHISTQPFDGASRPVTSSATYVVDSSRRLVNEIARRHEVEAALRESLRKLRAREEQLRDFVENAPLGLHRVSSDGTILWANAAELELLGYSAEEYVGRPIADVHADPVVIEDILSRLRRGEKLHNYEARLKAKDGSIKHTLISSSVYSREGKFIHTRCFTRDVTHRKELEIARSEDGRRAKRLLAITASIADAVSFEQVLEAVVDHVAETLGASTAALWLVSEDDLTLRLARARGYHPAALEQLEKPVSLEASLPFPALDAIRRREPVWIPSQAAMLQTYPHLRDISSAGMSYRVACLPLSAHGRILGSLGLTFEEAREATADEREFLQLAARYGSQAIERLRLLDAERQSRIQADAAAKRLAVLSQASRVFTASKLDFAARLRGVVDELATAMNSCINISILESDGLLRLAAVQHPNPEAQQILQTLALRAPVRLGEGVTGTIAKTGESVLVPAIDPETVIARAAPAYRSFLERFPAYALIGAALKVRGRVLGAVTATRVHEGETYTADDLRLLEELAERAAVAIENSRLYEETVGARSRAELLYRFASAVVAAGRIEDVYEAALASIERALAAKRTAILVYDADGVMRFKAWHGLSDAYRSAVEGHSPWPRDVVAPEPVLVSDVSTDAAMAPYLALFAREQIGGLAFIPLVSGGRLLGKFMVYYDQPHPFRPQEVEVGSAIANHLASVINRFAAVATLEETIRQNELFAGVLAHDLRNPLGAIMTAAQMAFMQKEAARPSPERSQRAMTRIMSSGRRMATMIEQLLDFTRARSGGGMEIYPHAADLGELVKQAVEELETAHADWKIDRDVRGELRGTWDSDRMLQVISNLVANAGHHGSSKAPIAVRLDGTMGNRVSIEVHNQGAIPESLLPCLFDPFRSTKHGRAGSRGLGLGLFIVREIVHAHGGTVHVESSEPSGTTFRIDLPRDAPQPSPRHRDAVADFERTRLPRAGNSFEETPYARSSYPPPGVPPRADENAAHVHAQAPTILVVDDDFDIREALEETLKEHGFQVITASDGRDALRRLRAMPSLPSLILLDLMMPVLDGYGFLDERRKDPVLSSIPVVVATAGHGFDRNRLGENTPIIPKPIQLSQLLNALRAQQPQGTGK